MPGTGKMTTLKYLKPKINLNAKLIFLVKHDFYNLFNRLVLCTTVTFYYNVNIYI